jgi:thiol-disulfide isomerase/thioredoxin
MTEANPGSGRIWWILALVFVSGWCLYLKFFGPAAPRQSGAPVLEGTALSKPADYDWMLSDLGGLPVPFDRFRGKTVFLNVWATWCPPCVAELPSIARLARTPKLDRVAFVCVAVDQDRAVVRRFLQGKDWPMTFLHAPEVPPAFTTPEGAIPTTFLIAPDGLIAASAVGGADWDDPSVVAFLERLAGAAVVPAGDRAR